jgi:hypothetical protein
MSTRAFRRRLGARLHHLITALVVALSAAAPASCGAAARGVGPTVKDLVEFTSIVHDQDEDGLNQQVSPAGTRAFIVTRRGDVLRDRTRYEFLLFDLRPDRLAAGRAMPPRSLLTIESSQDNDSVDPVVREPRTRWGRLAGTGRCHCRGPGRWAGQSGIGRLAPAGRPAAQPAARCRRSRARRSGCAPDPAEPAVLGSQLGNHPVLRMDGCKEPRMGGRSDGASGL